ncbi:MAG TPA: GNAT family N-acetyltransferase [Terriglobales bacterium]|nr:GNAT family N-acetyltransferase [Terriglobales bacterium]
MKIFGKPSSPTVVTSGRFELENDGAVAYLEYALAGKVLELIHTEVPEQMHGSGAGSSLVHSALEWAREHHVKVDVICPFAAEYITRHPEYSDLVVR